MGAALNATLKLATTILAIQLRFFMWLGAQLFRPSVPYPVGNYLRTRIPPNIFVGVNPVNPEMATQSAELQTANLALDIIDSFLHGTLLSDNIIYRNLAL
jgi:hypothetical protein